MTDTNATLVMTLCQHSSNETGSTVITMHNDSPVLTTTNSIIVTTYTERTTAVLTDTDNTVVTTNIYSSSKYRH